MINEAGKIIAISGSHGTGKSYDVLVKAASLKRMMPERKIGICHENAIRCPYPINKETSQISQKWIFTTHIAEELQLVSQYDILVSDRTAVDAIAYTAVAGFKELAERMLFFVEDHMSNYQQIFFKTIKNNDYSFPNGLRENEDKAFRQCIEEKLFELYGLLGINEKNILVIV